ncbi:MAG: hypothetical protein HC876_04420 [Chloroflexaceae bacterium]|nr:hypothetical protein [Chloroflexaceae bacterium]NJO04827.1 hypothetical protein [Chloroflexaceae bacterium]NJO82965.1 hypothetical protein [Blastochloris sp.]
MTTHQGTDRFDMENIYQKIEIIQQQLAARAQELIDMQEEAVRTDLPAENREARQSQIAGLEREIETLKQQLDEMLDRQRTQQ